MKKFSKPLVSFILVLVIFASMLIPAFAKNEERVISNVNEAYALVHENDFVEIYNATLNENGVEKQVYYVVCRGLDFSGLDPENPRGYYNCIKVGLSSENNKYVKAIVSLVTENVANGSDLVFVGHSLGGMVIQQVIAQKEIKDNYNVLYTLSIGSPYILTKGAKEGTLIRVVDRLDFVPFLSITLLANPYIGNVCIETSFEYPLVHFASYERGECWQKYDCLGVKNGNSFITINSLVIDAAFDF